MLVKSKGTVVHGDHILLDTGQKLYPRRGRGLVANCQHGDRLLVTAFITYSGEVLWWNVEEQLSLMGETKEEERARTNPFKAVNMEIMCPAGATLEVRKWMLGEVARALGVG